MWSRQGEILSLASSERLREEELASLMEGTPLRQCHCLLCSIFEDMHVPRYKEDKEE